MVVLPGLAEAQQPRRLCMLIMLLFALHILFGITAIIGVLIAHVSHDSTRGTVYHSQLHWLIQTFWLALAGYTIAFMAWNQTQMLWPVFLVAAWVTYRLLITLYHWTTHQPLTRRW